MGNQIETKVNPGDVVPGGFSHPNNATVSGDFLYLRDENGNQIAGRTVSDGDRITVLKVLSDKKLALIQYPAGSSVREGYVTNVVNIIKYDNLEKWVNGSTSEYVYETETSSEKIGSLDPREKATVLFKKGNRYNLVYNTSAGVRSKSGFVDYAGGSGGGSDSNGVRPGDVVPGGRTYPANAIVENDFLYLRDESGNQIAGRSVSIGDKITVLDISYSKQLALIQYPAGDVIRQGYVTNTTNIIRYLDEYNWYNGSTSETVYLNSTGNEVFGTLDAYESATKLYEKDGRVHVVYDTAQGMLTKSGYVNFGGLAVPPIGNVTIPSISASGVERIQYGTSGKGRALNAFKIGNGSKIMFAGFALHGFEDNWRHDGEALVKIATELVYKFSNYNGSNGLHGWTVYIAQCMNPDGVVEGRTNNGPGRCAVTTKIDMNRCFPYHFIERLNSREYTGKTPLGAPEAVALKNFVERLNKQASEMVVLDFHGWMTFSQGNSEIGRYFGNQFGFGHNTGYMNGFFTSWASTLENTKATLIEYPKSTRSYQDVLNGNYIGKTFNAMLNIMKNNPGSGSGGDGGSGNGNGDYDNNSEYHRALKVTTPLMRGEDVKKVQKKLNDSGCNAGTVDGVYGYGTEAAVIRFQEPRGLIVDGIVGKDTWNRLFGWIAPEVSYPNNIAIVDTLYDYQRTFLSSDLKIIAPIECWIPRKTSIYVYGEENNCFRVIRGGLLCYISKAVVTNLRDVQPNSSAQQIAEKCKTVFQGQPLAAADLWAVTYCISESTKTYKEYFKEQKFKVIKKDGFVYIERKKGFAYIKERFTVKEAEELGILKRFERIKINEISKVLKDLANGIGAGLAGLDLAVAYANEQEAKGEKINWTEFFNMFFIGVTDAMLITAGSTWLGGIIGALLGGVVGVTAGSILGGVIGTLIGVWFGQSDANGWLVEILKQLFEVILTDMDNRLMGFK